MIAALFTTIKASAAITSKTIEYSQNGVTMEGFVAYDDSKSIPQPGILNIHDWMGISNFTCNKAKQLAKQGYVVFAVDIYGKGMQPHNKEEASKLAGQFKNDRNLNIL